MADKPKGNSRLKIAIAVLTVFLLFTILYPKYTWKKQAELQNECRSRIEAIQQVEFQYMSAMNTYEDTLKNLMHVVRLDTNLLMSLDTMIAWDGIVGKTELQKMVMEKTLPQDLRDLILSKIEDGRPLGRLALWDSLEYKLINSLKPVISQSDTSDIIDDHVNWRILVGESGFWAIYESINLPTTAKNQIRLELRKDVPIQKTNAWKVLRATFIDTLKDIIQVAELPNTWSKEEREAWEVKAKTAWEQEMDNMSDTEKDSIWKAYQEEFWKKDLEQIWREERKAIWKKEGKDWIKENEPTWSRIIEHEWELRRKKEWINELIENQSNLSVFKIEASKDSLWRARPDSIKKAELAKWTEKENKYVQGVIDEIWDRERKAEWIPEAYQKWLNKKKETFSAFWEDLKEGLWNDICMDKWGIEEKRLAQKQNALNVLDRSVQWKHVIPNYLMITGALNLPDNKALWYLIDTYDPKKGSAIVHLGIAPLFRDVLMDKITRCPETLLPYQIQVEDTTAIKKFSVSCPIKEKEYRKYNFGFRAPFVSYYKDADFKEFIRSEIRFPLIKEVIAKKSYCEIQDSTTGEWTEVTLQPGFFEKVFGARTITPHGTIDMDGKKSWVKKN